MAEMTVRVEGVVSTTPAGTQTVAGTVTANQGTAAATASAWPIKISNGTSTADLAPTSPSALGNALLVTTGQLTGVSTLTAVTGNATGTTMDAGAAHANCTVVCVGTATLVGTITIEGSIDGTTFVSTGTTVPLTAAGTVTATSSGKAFRYYRASLSGAGGAGTATALIMAS